MTKELEILYAKIAEFNALIETKNKAEVWFDKTTTTDAEREKWTPEIMGLFPQIDTKMNELLALGYRVKAEEVWYGIKV